MWSLCRWQPSCHAGRTPARPQSGPTYAAAATFILVDLADLLSEKVADPWGGPGRIGLCSPGGRRLLRGLLRWGRVEPASGTVSAQMNGPEPRFSPGSGPPFSYFYGRDFWQKPYPNK